MRERLALRLLGRIMDWDEETATEEFGWLRLISRLKYDGYRDYLAGVRFVESLAGWLQQFEPSDRPAAYDFVRHRLVYVSPAEMQRLVELFYPKVVEPVLLKTIGVDQGIPPYMVWSDPAATNVLERRRRQTLFMGLSDGARIDLLRRVNAGILSTEQIVLATHIDEQKWEDLSENLCSDPLFQGDPKVKFTTVYLIDDFTASGTTFVRKAGKWKGKLIKFHRAVTSAREKLKDKFPIAEDFTLNVHHYISTAQARESILRRIGETEAKFERAVTLPPRIGPGRS